MYILFYTTIFIVFLYYILRRTRKKGVRLPKTIQGPDSSLKQYPLLYLFFDDFAELVAAVGDKTLHIGINAADSHSAYIETDDVLYNDFLFFQLWEDGLLRIKFNDGVEHTHAEELTYWEKANAVASISQESGNTIDPVKLAMKELESSIDATVNAIRIRYGIDQVDGRSTIEERKGV